jgi:aryl-alcohol dehydrogenase-like predicted oxidoreductase
LSKLILGTAQFGAGYGITNTAGRIDDSMMAMVVSTAASSGIETFDTAADYGDSQTRLGLQPGSSDRHYVTKFSLGDDAGVQPSDEVIFARSANALGVAVLDGVLFHRISDLSDDRFPAALAALRAARADGRIRRIGVSVYDSADLELALRRFPDLDLLQIPGSVVDRRLVDDPTVARLRSDGTEIHVRSAFLQGLLLSSPKSLPEFFSPLRGTLEGLARLAAEQETTVLGLAIRFLRDHQVVDGVIVGATSVREVSAIAKEWDDNSGPRLDMSFIVPPAILDPRGWPSIKVAQ